MPDIVIQLLGNAENPRAYCRGDVFVATDAGLYRVRGLGICPDSEVIVEKLSTERGIRTLLVANDKLYGFTEDRCFLVTE